jgi:hypothetical protein
VSVFVSVSVFVFVFVFICVLIAGSLLYIIVVGKFFVSY